MTQTILLIGATGMLGSRIAHHLFDQSGVRVRLLVRSPTSQASQSFLNRGAEIIEGDLGVRFMFWFAAMIPFLYVVYTLLVGLKEAIASEGNPKVASMLTQVCYATVISWCTYPVVYLFPMIGFGGPQAVIAIQLGYCVSDIISKCGVGFLIYNITITKSAALGGSLLGK